MYSSLLISSPDYKIFLKQVIQDRSHIKAIHSRLAEAAGCQKSYLSKVLNGEAHLLPDHAYGMAQYLGMSELEADYFLELVQLDRSGSPKLQNRQRQRLKKLQRQMENLQERFRADSLSEEEQQKVYYSSWIYSAVHMACGIQGLGTVPAISSRFQLLPQKAKQILDALARMKLVEEKSGIWVRSSQSVHVPFGSPMNNANHCNWSLKSLQDVQMEKSESLHYTAVYSLSKKDASELKHLLIKAIERTRDIVLSSPEEELVCLRVDLFEP